MRRTLSFLKKFICAFALGLVLTPMFLFTVILVLSLMMLSVQIAVAITYSVEAWLLLVLAGISG
jgi:hypothetical protein